jgi:hypothetical protein
LLPAAGLSYDLSLSESCYLLVKHTPQINEQLVMYFSGYFKNILTVRGDKIQLHFHFMYWKSYATLSASFFLEKAIPTLHDAVVKDPNSCSISFKGINFIVVHIDYHLDVFRNKSKLFSP